MIPALRRTERYGNKVRGLVIPGQAERYRASLPLRAMIEKCVKRAGIQPMLQFYYISFLEELLRHGERTRETEGTVTYGKWLLRGLDGPTMIALASCMGASITPYIPPTPCSAWETKVDCLAAGCCWTGLHCKNAPCACADYETQEECEAHGCYWWNSSCHTEPAPPPCEYECDGNTVALWHCDEGAGAQTDDACEPKYALTFRGEGEPAWTGTYHCPTHALHFDGFNDFMYHETLCDEGMANGTMEMWFRPDVTIDNGISATQLLWGKGGSASEYFYLLWEAGDGRLKWRLYSDTLGTVNLYSIQTTFTAGTWYHVAITWGSTGAKLYINGILNDSNATTRPLAAGEWRSFQVGGLTWVDVAFDGIIDEIRLSNIQRTEFLIP